MKLVFLFSDGSKFALNLLKLTKTALKNRIAELQAEMINAESEHKNFASGKTKLRYPISRPVYIGLDKVDGGTVVPLGDKVGNVARFKGYSLCTKIGKGKEATYKANPDFADFVAKNVVSLLGGSSLTSSERYQFAGALESEAESYTLAADEAKEKRAQKLLEAAN